MTNALLVCPSVTRQYAERFCSAVSAAMAAGADLQAVLVANSAATAELAARWPNLVVEGTNAGFAASINQGGAGRDFRWLVIVNDDMDFDAGAFGRLAAYLGGQDSRGHRLIRLSREPWRRLPGVIGVFANLSLLERAGYALGLPLWTELDAPSDQPVYPPFVLVAVSAALWRYLDGLEESLPFCYEDAWFVRKARASSSALTLDSHDLGIHHLRSTTTGSNIDLVLPVISWSALVYLQLLGVSRLAAHALCVAALLMRLPLSLVGSANRARHLHGIGRSLRVVVSGPRPSLPAPHSLAVR